MLTKIVGLFLIYLFVACSSGKKINKSVSVSNSEFDSIPGVEIIAKSDCLVCHRLEEKLVGPAYRDVANRYSQTDENITRLITKLQKGGVGVWGDVPMLPHPGLSDQAAKNIILYILSLKK